MRRPRERRDNRLRTGHVEHQVQLANRRPRPTGEDDGRPTRPLSRVVQLDAALQGDTRRCELSQGNLFDILLSRTHQ
jgi:hypothetical protein